MKPLITALAIILVHTNCIASEEGFDSEVRIQVGQSLSDSASHILQTFRMRIIAREFGVNYGSGDQTSSITYSYISAITGDEIELTISNDEVKRIYWIPGDNAKDNEWKTDIQSLLHIIINPKNHLITAELAKE